MPEREFKLVISNFTSLFFFLKELYFTTFIVYILLSEEKT